MLQSFIHFDMSAIGDLIQVNGHRERIVERELVLDAEGKPFYYAIRSEPVEESVDAAPEQTQP